MKYGSANLKLFFYQIKSKKKKIIMNSEPSIRGVLMACTGISSTTGIFIVYLLGTLLSWRQTALICAVIPITTLTAIFFVKFKKRITASGEKKYYDFLLCSLGTRNSNLAVVKESTRRCIEITPMVTGLGFV